LKKLIIVGGAIAVATVTLLALTGRRNAGTEKYRFVEIEQGDVEHKVSSTGRLEATTTVQVGTQISGRVVELFADFNDTVKKGQVIARIDTTLLTQEVRSAEAALARRQAEVKLQTQEQERLAKLIEQDLVTASEAEIAESNLAVAKADLTSAQAALERAKKNLEYATIRAPIDGVVVERTVDVGQTVAASLSSPQLFRIAEDLSQMRILVSVDESDIGRIREGQPARFTVQAFSEDEFAGTVRQVRLQSTTEENVVNYTVVVDVDNSERKLLPGMTATVDFVIDQAKNALKVPNAAIRFRPTEEMRAQLKGQGMERRTRNGQRNGQDVGSRSRPDSTVVLWFLDRGRLRTLQAHAGISDGQFTEIRGDSIAAGMSVIAGVTEEKEATNPFQAQRQPGGFGRPRPPGG
jgi:HlyD family secretion protein